MNKIEITSLGIDPGNGYIKLYDGTTIISEESCFAIPNNKFNKFPEVFEKNNREIIIGSTAANSRFVIKQHLSTSLVDRYKTKELYEIIAMYIAKNYNFTEINIKNACIGIPNNMFSLVKDDVSKLLNSKSYTIIKDGKKVEVNFNNIKVVPQPFGTYFLSKEIRQSNDTLIVDIGTGTIDYTYFSNNTIIDNFGTENGVKVVTDIVSNEIIERYPSYKLNFFKINDIIQSGEFRYGEIIKLDFIDMPTLKESYLKEILETLIDKYHDLRTFEKIFFTGGGANLIATQLNNTIYSNIELLAEGQINNVVGYYNIVAGV